MHADNAQSGSSSWSKVSSTKMNLQDRYYSHNT